VPDAISPGLKIQKKKEQEKLDFQSRGYSRIEVPKFFENLLAALQDRNSSIKNVKIIKNLK
jgi:hypothetical protein